MQYTLRPFTTSDAKAFATHANNIHIARFMSDGFPHPYVEEDAARFISQAIAHLPTRIFAIDINGEACGGIGIHPQENIYRYNAELGYWLAQPYWGNGIATRAINEVVAYAFANLQVNRIFARPFGTNTASQKVLEKAGFRLEARFEKTIVKNGILLDELVYAIRK